MTIYVDDARIPARIGRITGRWSHLVTDQPDLDELHAFAAQIGLARGWFQPGTSAWCPHYDVTDTKRRAALNAGAVAIRFRDTPTVPAYPLTARRRRTTPPRTRRRRRAQAGMPRVHRGAAQPNWFSKET